MLLEICDGSQSSNTFTCENHGKKSQQIAMWTLDGFVTWICDMRFYILYKLKM
jgi:hypothetical protein